MTSLRCYDHTLSLILNIVWLYGPKIRRKVWFIAPDTSIDVYIGATEADINLYPKLANPGRFIIDSNKNAKEITIKKIKHDIKFKEYAAYYTIADSTVQYYLKVFGTKNFANMFTVFASPWLSEPPVLSGRQSSNGLWLWKVPIIQ